MASGGGRAPANPADSPWKDTNFGEWDRPTWRRDNANEWIE
eukprot:CAMPEP_0168753392 /NCGR_PEP_ID=MMETSP0724-20121128/18912_1 /TAXON_ID=265536 /ORGANISM="Amphiprora sp., Strain CCMP467" /LENGTH=40 /DNA_ID= /DNA_START= /DNA_END= /DNA_ORIENTATION=